MLGLIFTYLLTYGGALVSLFYPYVGLLIYVGFAILKPEAMWFWSVPQDGNYSRIVAIALLAGWLLQGFGRWQFNRATGIVAALVGFFLWTLLGTVSAANQEVAWEFTESLFKIVLPFLVGITLIDSVAKLKQLAWVIVIAQGYVAYELNLDMWQNPTYNRVWEDGYAKMDNNSVAIGMVTGVGVAFFLALGARAWWQKALAVAAALFMAHVVEFSYSRGGMLALIITGVLGFLLTPRRPIHYAIFTVTVVAVLALAGPGVRDRFLTTFTDEATRDESARTRIKLWGENWELMQEYPIFGVGPHHWPLIAPEYGWKLGKEGHSLWLQIGAELGFPGVILLALFYALAVIKLWPLASESYPVPDPFIHDTARMVCAALIGFAVAAQFVSLTFLEVPYYVVLLGAGALKLASEPGAMPEPSPEPATEEEAPTLVVGQV